MKILGMLLVLLLVVSLGQAHIATRTQSSLSSNPSIHYVIPSDILNELPKARRPKVLSRGEGFSLVKMPMSQAVEVSEVIHHKKGGCGGFYDVESELQVGLESSFDFSSFKEQTSLSTLNEKLEVRYATKAKEMIPLLSESRFEATLKQLTSFPNRSARTAKGREASFWLKDQAEQFARESGRTDITVSLEATPRYSQSSVVIKIPGSTRQPGVVIGGHMDTTTGWRGGNSEPGADDDGTGTTTAFEVFRTLVESGEKFQRDIYIMFYAAEEMGLVGSNAIATRFRDQGIKLRGVLQYDMTGFRHPSENKDFYLIEDFTDSGLNNFAVKVADAALGIPKNRIGRTKCGYGCSDHASWNRKGYPTVYPFEASFDNYNRSIHTDGDTMSKLDLKRAMTFVRLGLAMIVELAEPISL